jgi:putative ABC transport system permease protein
VPRWLEALVTAASVIGRYPGRSALTVLGLAIGVAAFISTVAFGEGARQAVVLQFQPLGVNVFRIGTVPEVHQARGRPSQPLGNGDVAALERELTSVRHVLPLQRRNADVGFEGRSRFTMLWGTTPPFAGVHEWKLESGGLFDDNEVSRRARVCVIGATPARELFGRRDPLGQTLDVAGALSCRVVGVLQSKGHNTAGTDLDDLVIIPLSTFQDYLGASSGYTFIEIQPQNVGQLAASVEEARVILRRTHGIEAEDLDDFVISSPLDVVRAVEATSRILSALLGGIAAVALVVGGIGIMNIQLVSVAERTQEIGIRSAIGAAPGQILSQFLLEAVMLSLCGALVGVTIGVGAAVIVAARMDWPRIISPLGVLISLAFGLAVGVLFGYLPARRASRLEPILALRHE